MFACLALKKALIKFHWLSYGVCRVYDIKMRKKSLRNQGLGQKLIAALIFWLRPRWKDIFSELVFLQSYSHSSFRYNYFATSLIGKPFHVVWIPTRRFLKKITRISAITRILCFFYHRVRNAVAVHDQEWTYKFKPSIDGNAAPLSSSLSPLHATITRDYLVLGWGEGGNDRSWQRFSSFSSRAAEFQWSAFTLFPIGILIGIFTFFVFCVRRIVSATKTYAKTDSFLKLNN